jgi:integrase
MRPKNKISKMRSAHTERDLFVWANPGKVIDRNGRPVDTTGNIWSLQDPTANINLNWNTLITAADIKIAIQCFLAYMIEMYAPKTAHHFFKELKYCLVRLPPFKTNSDISYEAIEGALAKARQDRKEWHFHYVRKWYQWCCDRGIKGFNSDLASRLYRLKIISNSKGVRVMSRDPDDGPLSRDEHFLIREAVKAEKGRLLNRVIIMLLLETGARPVQLVQIEEQDIFVTSGAGGYLFYSVNIPRAKQRQIGKPEKKRRRISADLGLAIQRLIKANHAKHGEKGPQMPVLCARNVNRKKLTKELWTRFKFHLKVCGLAQRVQGYSAQAGIVSRRTGKVLKLYPLRLRYTYLTFLAEQGAAANHLAELADHSNDKSIGVYTSSTSSVVERLNAALGSDSHYSGLIGRFLGQLVTRAQPHHSSAVIRGATPTLKTLGGIGVCGANFLCDLYPPLSCYVCPKFQAWTDGPHKELLQELEIFVHSLIERSANQADRIPYQLTNVITSIRELLTRIEEMKNRGRNLHG